MSHPGVGVMGGGSLQQLGYTGKTALLIACHRILELPHGASDTLS
jgi:hypothetical protein